MSPGGCAYSASNVIQASSRPATVSHTTMRRCARIRVGARFLLGPRVVADVREVRAGRNEGRGFRKGPARQRAGVVVRIDRDVSDLRLRGRPHGIAGGA